MKYVIVLAYSQLFAGELESQKGRSVVLRNARGLRLWNGWDSTWSLLRLAKEGINCPSRCQFTCEIDRIELFKVKQILDATEAARESIIRVPAWN